MIRTHPQSNVRANAVRGVIGTRWVGVWLALAGFGSPMPIHSPRQCSDRCTRRWEFWSFFFFMIIISFLMMTIISYDCDLIILLRRSSKQMEENARSRCKATPSPCCPSIIMHLKAATCPGMIECLVELTFSIYSFIFHFFFFFLFSFFFSPLDLRSPPCSSLGLLHQHWGDGCIHPLHSDTTVRPGRAASEYWSEEGQGSVLLIWFLLCGFFYLSLAWLIIYAIILGGRCRLGCSMKCGVVASRVVRWAFYFFFFVLIRLIVTSIIIILC